MSGLPTTRPTPAEHEILVQSVGVFTLAQWISLFIQGANFAMLMIYLQRYWRTDPWYNSWAAIAANVMTFAFNVIICVEGWIKTVDEAGDFVAIQGFAFVHGFGSLLAPSADFVVQIWYCHRLWLISALGVGHARNALFPAFILLISFVSWAFGFACGIYLLILRGNALLFTEDFLYGVYVWQCLSGAADVFITAGFGWFLMRNKSMYKSTNNVLLTVFNNTVEANLPTAILAIANAIALGRVQLGVNALLAGLLTNSYVTSLSFSLLARSSVDSLSNRSLPAYSGSRSIHLPSSGKTSGSSGNATGSGSYGKQSTAIAPSYKFSTGASPPPRSQPLPGVHIHKVTMDSFEDPGKVERIDPYVAGPTVRRHEDSIDYNSFELAPHGSPSKPAARYATAEGSLRGMP